ncbi:MAG: redoxin domain-containing protein [Coriobacteriia bacterium]
MSDIQMPAVGDAAPAIDAPITGDGRFVLSEHTGKWVVVYFFPRANTPG